MEFELSLSKVVRMASLIKLCLSKGSKYFWEINATCISEKHPTGKKLKGNGHLL